MGSETGKEELIVSEASTLFLFGRVVSFELCCRFCKIYILDIVKCHIHINMFFIQFYGNL